MTNDWDWDLDSEEEEWTGTDRLLHPAMVPAPTLTFHLPKRHRDFFQFQLWHLVQYDKVMKEMKIHCEDKLGVEIRNPRKNEDPEEPEPETESDDSETNRPDQTLTSSGLSAVSFDSGDLPLYSGTEGGWRRKRTLGEFPWDNQDRVNYRYNYSSNNNNYNNANKGHRRDILRSRHSNRKLDQYKVPQRSSPGNNNNNKNSHHSNFNSNNNNYYECNTTSSSIEFAKCFSSRNRKRVQ